MLGSQGKQKQKLTKKKDKNLTCVLILKKDK